jgi:hypothetical protein
MMQKTTKKSDIVIKMEIVNEKYPSSDGKGNQNYDTNLISTFKNKTPAPRPSPPTPIRPLNGCHK